MLVDHTPDRGKESPANLDWTDIQLLKELLLKRINVSKNQGLDFEEVWRSLFESHVGGQDSFTYIIDRTFMRPRDVLNFVIKCIQTAVSRKRLLVQEADIRAAETAFSEDMLNDLRYEIRDVFPQFPDLLNAFIGHASDRLSADDIQLMLSYAEVGEGQVGEVKDVLLWFSFLGIAQGDQEHFSYLFSYNLAKLKSLLANIPSDAPIFIVHPSFRKALDVNKGDE